MVVTVAPHVKLQVPPEQHPVFSIDHDVCDSGDNVQRSAAMTAAATLYKL